jgi:hypothetical protein
LPRGLPTRYVPPSGFGYPPGVLLPAIPCRFFFTPAALLGFTLRRFLLPVGIRSVTTRMNPHTVRPTIVPAAEAVGRPSRSRFLGFDPPRSSWQPIGGLARRPLEPPMGFALLGFSGKNLGRSFLPPPLTRFADRQKIAGPPASQSIDRSSLSLPRPPVRNTNTGRDSPSRVSAPALSRAFEQDADSAMNSPSAGSHITADTPTVLSRLPSLYRSCRDGIAERTFPGSSIC